MRGWRIIVRRRGVRYLKYGRSWLRIRRYGRRYRIIYRGKIHLIFRGKSKYQVRFRRKWRYIKRRGRSRYIRIRRKWVRVNRRRRYFMRFKGRRLAVRRRRGKFQLRWKRRWLRGRRARYGKRRVRGSNEQFVYRTSCNTQFQKEKFFSYVMIICIQYIQNYLYSSGQSEGTFVTKWQNLFGLKSDKIQYMKRVARNGMIRVDLCFLFVLSKGCSSDDSSARISKISSPSPIWC